jgi:hypothetical protein
LFWDGFTDLVLVVDLIIQVGNENIEANGRVSQEGWKIDFKMYSNFHQIQDLD